AMVPAALNIGSDVVSILQNDLAVELQVVADLRKAIKLCEQHGDYVSREQLLPMLDDTEIDHAHWLEQQLRLIQLMGLQNYIQSQAGA
ncbi:MAG: ferritin-like domain-containing protein, partial [Burkholderiales bacterium]